MSVPDFREEHPYRAPDPTSDAYELVPSTPADRELLRRFHGQASTLAVIWMACGLICLFGVVAFFSRRDALAGDAAVRAALKAGVMGAMAVASFALATFCHVKHSWPIYVGLAFVYFAAYANWQRSNMPGVLLFVAVIVLSHRAIISARRLQRLGVPLDEEPNSLHHTRRRRYD